MKCRDPFLARAHLSVQMTAELGRGDVTVVDFTGGHSKSAVLST
jgi:hypothetical protein